MYENLNFFFQHIFELDKTYTIILPNSNTLKVIEVGKITIKLIHILINTIYTRLVGPSGAAPQLPH